MKSDQKCKVDDSKESKKTDKIEGKSMKSDEARDEVVTKTETHKTDVPPSMELTDCDAFMGAADTVALLVVGVHLGWELSTFDRLEPPVKLKGLQAMLATINSADKVLKPALDDPVADRGANSASARIKAFKRYDLSLIHISAHTRPY